MATTMNPPELYRDPALDDAVLQSTRSRQKSSSNRRNGEQERRSNGQNINNLANIPQSLDAPTGPTVTYRGEESGPDPTLNRSFSQRAKGRPFADEAFADDGFDEYSSRAVQQPLSRPAVVNQVPESPLQLNPPRSNGPTEQTFTQPGRRSLKISSSATQTKPRISKNEGRAVPESSSASRSVTLKDAGNQTDDQQKNWASDRSPLQKLEVKLTDISKEEKRARVQEAEMRLRESQGSQGPGRSQRQVDQAPRAVSQPERINPQRIDQAIQPSAIPPRQNAAQIPTSNARDINPNNGQRVSRQGPMVDIPVRQYGSGSQRNTMPTARAELGLQQPPNPQTQTRQRTARSSSGNQAVNNVPLAQGTQSRMPRSASLQNPRPQGVPRTNDRPLSERERNASHQAALQQLTGQSPPGIPPSNAVQAVRKSQALPQRTKSGGRSAAEQNSPVPVDLGTLAGDESQFGGPSNNASRRTKIQPTEAQRSQPLVGLGVQSPPPSRQVMSQSYENVDGSKNRPRRSSVSFKEPFDKRRPVDEWKTAETARLTGEDFSTEPAKEAETYKAWWEQDQAKKGSKNRVSSTYKNSAMQIDDRAATFNPPLHLKCGPLLRYAGIKRAAAEAGTDSGKELWRGTIMIVTQDSQCSYEEIPTLRLFSQPKKLLPPPPALVDGDQLAPEYIDPIAGLTKLSRTGRSVYVRPVDHLEEAKDLSRVEDDNGIFEASPSPLDVNGTKNATAAAINKRTLETDGEKLGRFKEVRGVRIYADPDRDVTFWRFNIEIELGPEQQHIAYRINKGASVGFWVPAQGQSMNIMFQSCNGFSLNVNPNEFSGPDPLWRDVLNNHQTRPFHVMIGGGDQVYNDRVMVDTEHFGEWTKIKNPHHKHQAPFTPEMKDELETFYLERYSMWFSQGLFAMANASIPMVNVWDDHDIIDGYGSYPDHFMKSPVFVGLGDVAHKYYLLFQHQSIDAMTEKDEPSWVLGKKPGPYIQHVSRSVYMELGRSVAFLGLDGRTERTREDVISMDTLEILLDRCRREMVEGKTKHLIVLLGVPIAYPRLVWLENMLTSRALEPIKALHRAGIVKTKLLNRFDGGVEILDDLDDHWTASHHKDERHALIEELQDLAAEKSARVTILSGDVHLAAIGQFYSNPKLKIPKDKDHRYMPNIISSAIVNTPPPDMLADVLNKRNKVHHLDKYTDENMIPVFTHDVDDKKRNNTRLLPRRNWCSIQEYVPGQTPPPTPPSSSSGSEDDASVNSQAEDQYQDQSRPAPKRRLSLTKKDFNPRNLMRRISSRGAPPTAYKSNTNSDQYEQRAASFDGTDRNRTTNQQPPQPRASSADHIPDVPALRPTFQRRPTNLSEKAAKKGIVPDVDEDGNEIHFNDHINLEGGLDVVLNCEINQKDPAGITTQYRLLVPALWYDGSSDREKIETRPAPPGRRNTLLQKFGLNARKENRAADSQGDGNWGQEMSETESYSGSEVEEDEPPKKRFSFFGSKRKKQAQQPEIGEIHHPHLTAGQIERNGQQNAPHDHPVPSTNDPSTKHRSFGEPTGNTISREPTSEPAASRETSEPVHQSTQRPGLVSRSQQGSQRSSRPLSYIIGGSDERPAMRPEYSTSYAEGRPPYDPDAAYVSKQQQGSTPSVQRQGSARQSNQARLSGGSSMDGDWAQTQPKQLRGNGIIGKNIPPSSYRNSNVSENYDQQEQSKGYSGIEAYKDPKPRRRWSLREKARNMMESFESRRKGDGDDWYSDEEEEAYWEGQSNAQPQNQVQRQPTQSQSYSQNQAPRQRQAQNQGYGRPWA